MKRRSFLQLLGGAAPVVAVSKAPEPVVTYYENTYKLCGHCLCVMDTDHVLKPGWWVYCTRRECPQNGKRIQVQPLKAMSR